MSEFERELKHELRRVPAPDGFADGVMDLVARERRARTRKARRWLAAAVLLGVLSGISVVGKQHHEHRQAEIAQHQFELAMQVTGKTLAEVERRISRAGTNSSEVEP